MTEKAIELNSIKSNDDEVKVIYDIPEHFVRDSDNQVYAIYEKDTNLIANTMICYNVEQAKKNFEIAMQNLKKMGISETNYMLVKVKDYEIVINEKTNEEKNRIEKNFDELKKEFNND